MYNQIDQSLFCLNQIAELANEKTGKFSITQKDGYYYISVGDNSYAAPVLTNEALMSAVIHITSRIANQQKWWG